jgi:uncharacterized protein (DUF433 family)
VKEIAMSADQTGSQVEHLSPPLSGERQGSVIVSHPEIMSGTPVFAGTRVPVEALIDYLKAGDTLDEFLDQFPTVSRDQAIAALEQMGREAIETARANPAR